MINSVTNQPKPLLFVDSIIAQPDGCLNCVACNHLELL